MRIVYLVTRSDSIGGALVHVRDLSAALLARGHEVTVLAGGEGVFTRQLQEMSVPFVSLGRLKREINPLQDMAAWREIYAALKELGPELISTHMSKAGLLGRLAGRALNIPVIFTAHGWAFTEGVPAVEGRIYRWAEKAAAPLAARIITVSRHDRELAKKYGVARAPRLVAVHNGVFDIDPKLLAEPGRPEPRLVMVARFERQKDHATLFKALSGLTDLPWELDLVGDGPLEGRMAGLAESLGLAERINFLGACSGVGEILSRAQIFLLISHWEGFPRSILEAMRAGLPVLASDVGGVRESVADGITGYVVPPRDSEALREKLWLLLSGAELRQRLGAAGRERYEQSFGFETMFENTLQVYREVLGRQNL